MTNKIIKTPEQIIKDGRISGHCNADFAWSEYFTPENGKPALNDLRNAKKTLDLLSWYKWHVFGGAAITITDGWRSMANHLAIYKKINDARKKQGLDPKPIPMGSYHLKALAVDFTVAGLTRQQVFIKMDLIHFGGVEIPDEQNRTHIDLRPSNCRFNGTTGAVVKCNYNEVEHNKVFKKVG